jgi:hypothetical protein
MTGREAGVPASPAARNQATLHWRTAERCQASGCVEVAALADGVAMRDGKTGDSAVLSFSREEFRVFVAGVKSGDFDDLC